MKRTQKRTQNILLILGVVVLALIPMWIVEKPAAGPDGEEVAIFGGSDDKAKNLIGEIRPASRRADLFPIFSFTSAGLWVSGAERSSADPAARLSRWRSVLERMREEGFALHR